LSKQTETCTCCRLWTVRR